MGFALMLQILNDKERKGRGKKKSLPLIYRSLAGKACQNIPRQPSGKMTQAALALSGMVVLARTHSKLESIFPSLDVCACVWWGRSGAGNGQEGK